jgi:ABC-type glycerol-3-phosphate transport system permease component
MEQQITSKALTWITSILIVALSGFALHKIYVKGETAFVMFCIVAALFTSIFKQIPFFAKYKMFLFIPPTAAVILLILAIMFE